MQHPPAMLSKQEKCHEQTAGPLSLLQNKGDSFADGHGQVYHTNRDWEDSYRQRWQFDKIVRSTHGVNCTGSCGWKIYVKNGLVTRETQQTDYPHSPGPA